MHNHLCSREFTQTNQSLQFMKQDLSLYFNYYFFDIYQFIIYLIFVNRFLIHRQQFIMELKHYKPFRHSTKRFKINQENFSHFNSKFGVKYLDLTQHVLSSKNKYSENHYIQTNLRLPSTNESKKKLICLTQNLIQKIDTEKPQLITKQNLHKVISEREISNSVIKKPTIQSSGRISIPKIQIKKQDQIKKFLENFLSEPSYLSNYQILSHIGKGCFAAVSLAIEKSTQKHFAVKIYEKSALKDINRLQNIKREIKNLKALNHKNIITLIHAISDKRKIFLVMDYAGRHSLEGIIRKKQSNRLSQIEAKRYFQQILSAVACCHKNNITHRDIKLQNILVSETDQIKLIDFGFSVMSKQKLNIFCGTPSYMSPEIVGKLNYEGSYVDIWACGVLLYVMLCGTYPFRGMNEKQLYRNIKNGKYQIKQDLKLSQGAKRLLSKMLKVIPNQRTTAEQLLFDKWFEQ